MNEIDIVTRLRTRAPMDQSLRRLLVEAAEAIETGRQLIEAADFLYSELSWLRSGSPDRQDAADEALRRYEALRNNAAAMFDAIETGRQWKTIARRLADAIREVPIESQYTSEREALRFYDESAAAFRDVAARTPTKEN